MPMGGTQRISVLDTLVINKCLIQTRCLGSPNNYPTKELVMMCLFPATTPNEIQFVLFW